MFRTVKHITAALALTGLVLSQPALAVRSSDSLPAAGARVSTVDNRVGTPIGHSQHANGSNIGYFIGAGIGIGALIIILSDKNQKKSPG